jgi:hypothetical protein
LTEPFNGPWGTDTLLDLMCGAAGTPVPGVRAVVEGRGEYTTGRGPTPFRWSLTAGPTRTSRLPWRSGLLGHMLPFGGDRSALVSHRVTDRLHADQAVAKHKSVDAIVSVCCRGISGPLQEEQITIEDLGLQCPGCVR